MKQLEQDIQNLIRKNLKEASIYSDKALRHLCKNYFKLKKNNKSLDSKGLLFDYKKKIEIFCNLFNVSKEEAIKIYKKDSLLVNRNVDLMFSKFNEFVSYYKLDRDILLKQIYKNYVLFGIPFETVRNKIEWLANYLNIPIEKSVNLVVRFPLLSQISVENLKSHFDDFILIFSLKETSYEVAFQNAVDYIFKNPISLTYASDNILIHGYLWLFEDRALRTIFNINKNNIELSFSQIGKYVEYNNASTAFIKCPRLCHNFMHLNTKTR